MVGRRMLTRQITKTTIKVAKMVITDGVPEAIALPDEVVIGSVKMERAQRLVDKKFEESVHVLEVHEDTETYEMPIKEFLELATIKEVEEED